MEKLVRLSTILPFIYKFQEISNSKWPLFPVNWLLMLIMSHLQGLSLSYQTFIRYTASVFELKDPSIMKVIS